MEHNLVRAGHLGVNGMYASIKRHYYWESLDADVCDWVASCASCARNRIASRLRTAMLKLFRRRIPSRACLWTSSVPLQGPRVGTSSS